MIFKLNLDVELLREQRNQLLDIAEDASESAYGALHEMVDLLDQILEQADKEKGSK